MARLCWAHLDAQATIDTITNIYLWHQKSLIIEYHSYNVARTYIGAQSHPVQCSGGWMYLG